ncbi:hypothetical protein GQ457_05G033310 [Hibiscus cannabinus]
MVEEEKVVNEVSGWLRVYDDGSVDRTWTGPLEVKFMAEPVPPHDQFIDGVATWDVTIDPSSNLRVRIYFPEERQDPTSETMLPIILHFHGGGFHWKFDLWLKESFFYRIDIETRKTNTLARIRT